MRIVWVTCLFGIATTAPVGYDFPIPGAADLPLSTDYPNVGVLELNTFAPNFGSDSYRVDTDAVDDGLNKEFYHFSAPDDDLESSAVSRPKITRIKKNLRVVFIKAPENNVATNALRLAKQLTSDRTVIYVLSKQPDAAELSKQVADLRNSISHKPEVHFVKYRTDEDATNAQLIIQKQYDTLRGTSRSLNEGVAPVLDFSSSSQSDGATEDERSLTADEGRKYIPPNL